MKKLFFVFAFMLSLMTIKAQEMVVGITTAGDSIAIGIDYIPIIVKDADSSVVYIVTNTLTSVELATPLDSLLAQSTESWVKVTVTGTYGIYVDGDVVLVNRSQILRMTEGANNSTVFRMKSRKLDLRTTGRFGFIVIDVVDGF